MDGWIERIKRLGVTGVASVAGMAPRGRDRYSPCPACGTARLSDGRAPVVVGSRGGFECQVGSCKASGDAVDVLSWKIAGKRLRDASPDDRARVKAAAEEARIIDGDDRGGGGGFAREPRLVASVQPKAARMVTYRSARGGAVTVDEGAASGGGEGRISGRDFTFREGLAEEAITRLWEDPEAAPALAYLRAGRGELPGGASGRRFPDEAIRVWKLGAWRHPDGGWWVTIPLLDPRSGDIVNVKFRRVPLEDGSCPKPKYMACPGRPLTLFGARSLSNDLGATVLIVEGELDVVAFWCFGYERDVVSGTSGASSWEESWLDVLEPYDAFTTVYDDDEAGQEGKGKTRVIEALGKDRCAEAKLPRKDAGECWLDGVAATEIDAALARARPIVGMRLTNLVDAFDDFERRQASGRSAVQGFPTYCAPLDALFGSWPCGLTVITGYPGRGKAQPVDEIVLTPEGWIRIGELRVDDQVIGCDGAPTRVRGVYPQGRREVFEVEFDDGTVVRADGEHLWSVKRGMLWDHFKVKTTSEIAAYLQTKNGKIWVPFVGPVQHPIRDLPIDPYVLGVLLGDGALTRSGVVFTSADAGVLAEVERRLPSGHRLKARPSRSAAFDCAIVAERRGQPNRVAEALRVLSLRGLSPEKRVPRSYMLASVEQRMDLLRGLFDTDGGVESGQARFYTTSPGLAEDVAELIRSMGGMVRIWSKMPTYRHRGERRIGRRAWTVAVSWCSKESELFGLARKAERITERRCRRRRIVRVSSAGEADCVCIAVEHPAQLYVTRGHVLTHNTSFATWAAVEQARHGTPAILTSFEQGGDGSLAKILRQFLGKDYSEASREEIAKARAMFSSMPLILADRDGKADIDELLWTIRYSIRRLGGKFWVIDHLGYLINHESRVNEVAQIDKITQALATLGRSERVAICLLAHVRANSERFYRGNEQRPRLGQLRGSSSIEGECALGLVVEKEILNKTKEYSGDPGVIIYNDKQRSEWGAGEGSKCTLYYDPIACVYSDRWELLPNADRGRGAPIGSQDPPPADTPPPRSSTSSARSARRSPTEGGTTP